MTSRTADESLTQYIKLMGRELGTIYHLLLQSTIRLSAIWDQHETLFENKDRIALLNASGGYFFGNVQRAFFQQVLLGISKLTDPPGTGSKKNLSLKCLPALVTINLKDEIASLVSIADDASSFCRDWRNRHIAHNDLDRALEVGLPLESATRDGVTNALIAIQNVLRLPANRYCDTDLLFVTIDDNSPTKCLYRLYQGQLFENARREKVGADDWNGIDQQYPKWLNSPDRMNRFTRRST